MIKEINDKARRDDPVKTHAFAIKTQKQLAEGNNNNSNPPNRHQVGGGRGGRGRGRGRGNNNSGGRGGGNGGGNNTPAITITPGKTVKADCECGRNHYGAGASCWFLHPNLATPEWREKQAAYKARNDAAAAVAIHKRYSDNTPVNSENDSDCGFALVTTITSSLEDVAHVSE
ncbi:hypothetical protein EJ02DRAFT_468461 [Clathrospora elynae]|uniref:Uncharacterized protein n=1 Tax=Clathrospora elynae TaxID=706981 RepID=A0A6A5SKD4_9PLEO|nr:hypothetical protein EJ02DRAFT_468461 [Clathrospora elynae]